jgi:type 1 glutamine amidotransferase
LATPQAPNTQQHRWLGYDPGTGAETRFQAFAGYTNLALLPVSSRLQATHLQLAHQQGLQLLLPVTTRESMEELAAKFDLLRNNPDPVLGVVAVCPPYYQIQARELTGFAAKLKAELPSCEFWVALADGGKEPSAYALPALADGLMIDVLDCSTPSEVERRKRDVWPKWRDQAAGRSVVLCWDNWQKGSLGLVSRVQLGTFRACGDAVEELKLQGVLFSTYGENWLQGEAQVGIETRPDLVLEVQAIARRWNTQKVLPYASAQTNRPASNPAPAGLSEPIRAVIVTGDDVTVHRWRETSRALREVLDDEPQLIARVEEDPNFLASNRLFDHQVLVLNFSNREPLSQQQTACANLEKFVRQGGGLMVIHAAAKAFPDWDRFVEIAGKKMADLATHDPIRAINVHISDSRHAVTQGVRDFQVRDELPTCLEGNTSIQVLATARSSVSGTEYPVAFVLNFGAGRVFHLTLGHSPAAIRTREIAALIRRAALWVGTPTNAIPQSNSTSASRSERTSTGGKSVVSPKGATDV